LLSPEQVDDQIELYREQRPTFADLARKLAELISELLVQEKIEIVRTENRPKDVDAFKEKMQRDGKSYSNPLVDITDLSGVRVIAYTNEEVLRIGEIIERQFSVVEKVERGGLLDPDRFGYRSMHYIVTLTDDRAQMPEWQRFSGLKSEIQVRTVLQHAWAAIDHRLRYKSPIEIPTDVKRRLFRISALLECSDDEFSWVIHEINRVRQSYEEQFKRGQLDAEINRESVEIFTADSEYNKALVTAAKSSGFHIGPLPSNSKDPYVNLLRTIELAGVKSISDLERLIRGFEERAAERLKCVHEAWAKHSIVQVLNTNLPTLFRLVVALESGANLPRILDEAPFGEVLQNALVAVTQPDLNTGTKRTKVKGRGGRQV
jgi:ppGpp synthetase/RelA/SpoT-type nucleotidyltranferase